MPATSRSAALAAAAVLVLGAGAADAVTGAAAPRPLVLTGEAVGDRAGFQISTGDLDGDGHEDLVVGAFKNTRGGKDAGALYVEYGPVRRGFSFARADARLYGGQAFDFLAEGPVGVVDLDGDGRDDLLVGAPGSYVVNQGTPKVGETYVLYGGARLRGSRPISEVASATLTGVHAGEWLGFGAAGVGDLDGDGREDAALGAPATAGYTGALHLLYGRGERLRGRVPVADVASATLLGAAPEGMFGYEAAGGDLDGDGVSDLVVAGAPLSAPQPAPLHVFYGRKGTRLAGLQGAPAAADAVLVPSVPAQLGTPWWLSVDDDLTGDGRADLVASTATNLNAQRDSHTWVVPGGRRLPRVSALDSAATTVVRGAGFSHDTGDLTGDGRADLVVGQRSTGVTSVFAGPLRAGVVAADRATRRFTTSPELRGGQSVAVADLTGDGRKDLLVGADELRTGPGRVYVLVSGR